MSAGKLLRISQIKVNISEIYRNNREEFQTREAWEQFYRKKEMFYIKKKSGKILGCSEKEIKQIHIIKRSLDARKKKEICYSYVVEVEVGASLEKKLLDKEKKKRFSKANEVKYQYPEMGEQKLKHPPVVVGFGPAGMFCAWELAKAGYKPIVFEQGKKVEERLKDVEAFWKNGILMPQSNVQFGEGGAGTFSDGKLNTTVKDPSGRNRKVLEIFVENGASEEILYQQKPHIGTDVLCKIVKNMRENILKWGGEIHFQSKVTNIRLDENGNLTGVQINDENWIHTQVAVFAIGHSARDTFELFEKKKVHMEQKPFAIGVRVEHEQSIINENQYGELADILPAADYKLTHQAKNGRSIFSFCMCPGGFVVDASSEKHALVVNGMSNSGRDEKNANSALVVNVVPEDFEGNSVLDGVEFQRKWEKKAYLEGKGKVPVQLFGDFKKKKTSTAYGNLKPIHKGKTEFGNLWNCLPGFVCETIAEGIEEFSKRIPGFDREDIVLSGVETRTSSPVRITRNEKFEGNYKGFYPCGEGAGYAGGITSAAMDGLRVYEAIRQVYQPLEEN